MQHLILRCKHCNKEYTYCTYGNGEEYGTENGCSKEYCAECQNAIYNALSKIPKKYEPRFKKIKEPRLLDLFDELRVKHLTDGSTIGCFREWIGDYDCAEYFIHNRKKYMLAWNDDNMTKKDIYISMEYDLINKKFTENVWKFDEGEKYSFSRNIIKEFTKLESIKITQPDGRLFYFDSHSDFDTWEVCLTVK